MAKYPNADCADFCYWMLNVSWQQLTPPRSLLITTVYNAAVAGTSVTDTEWNNFIQVTNWRDPSYEIYLKYNNQYSSNSLAYWAVMSTQPSVERKKIDDDFIKELEAYGIFTQLDRLTIFATELQSQAVFSMANPSSTPCTEMNSPTWYANKGYFFNGSSTYLKSNFIPSTNGVNYTLNGNSFGVYHTGNNDIRNGRSLGVYDGTNYSYFVARYTGDLFLGPNNSTDNYFQVPSDTAIGLFVSSRSVSNDYGGYINGLSKNRNTTASTNLPTKEFYIGCTNNNGSPGAYLYRGSALYFMGSALINQTKFYELISIYASRVGFFTL